MTKHTTSPTTTRRMTIKTTRIITLLHPPSFLMSFFIWVVWLRISSSTCSMWSFTSSINVSCNSSSSWMPSALFLISSTLRSTMSNPSSICFSCCLTMAMPSWYPPMGSMSSPLMPPPTSTSTSPLSPAVPPPT
eukprot:gnl/Chilomastix_caulleri/206.p1 GENE.gnl/Chilomastix_caulleri/206~~gnl/Chilomastix_caulleri/206.p1  ORF type:complete len:134 (-),score=24.62 gnl/Chilomastix_caulleri/206:28-429(-)